MPRSTALVLAIALLFGTGAVCNADDTRLEVCKAMMNKRIQACTDECTTAALAATPDYKDVNNNVKFGCLKGCALRQVFQMQVCRSDKG